MFKRWMAPAALVVVVATAATAYADRYENEDLGFSLNTPKKWKEMPVAHDSGFLVARFHCDREYEWSDPKTNDWTYHRPYIDVVVIPHSVRESKKARVERGENGEIIINEDAPFKSLREYLEVHCKSIGGFYVSDEQEDEEDGFKILKYEVTVDRLVSGPRKVYGWGYETEDATYCLIGETLIDKEDDVGKDLLRSFRSLKTFARKGSLPKSAHTGDSIEIVDPDKDEDEFKTPEQIAEERDAEFRRHLKRLEGSLPDGWDIVEDDHYVAVTHVDRKYTKEVLDHAEALHGWLEENLGYIGSGHVGKVIIRICADSDEANSYNESGGWSSDAPEIVTYEDNEGWSDWAMESLNRGIYRQWVKDKNDRLMWAAPAWFSDGIRDFVANAKSKRRKVEFEADTWDQVEMKKYERDDKLLAPYDFFSMTSEDLWGDHDNWGQTQFFVKYLLVGKGSKSSRYREVIGDYIRNLIVMLDEEEPDDTTEEIKEPESEEEEDRMFRERQQSWRQKEREKLDELLERTFGDWSESDWEKFEKHYLRSVT